MGFFDSLFGADDARNDLRRANAKGDATLTQGAADARGDINTGYDQAQNFLASALRQVGSGYGQARGDLQAGETRAMGMLDPYMQSGAQANTLYGNALGLNGLSAQRAFGQNFAASDPFRAQNEDMANEALMRVLNARGMSGSGFAGEAVARQSLARGSEDYNNYLNRLLGVSQAGQNAASQGAGIATNTAGQLATMGANRGAQTSNILAQRAGYASDRGNTLGNLTYGVAQQRAGQQIGLGNAISQTRGAGVNNLLGLAGTAMKAFG